MKISRYIISFLLSIFTAISCVEERIPSGAQLADVPCVLNVDKGTISFEAQVSTADLAITSKNVSWELTGAPEWLTVSQKNGTGTATVTITAAENVDVDNSRVAVLQLKSTTGKYEYSKNITVSQVAAIKYVYVDTPSLTLAPQSSQAIVTVSSNVEWEAVCSAGWLALSKNDAAALSVTAGENTTAGSRTTTITLRRVGTTQSLASIRVVQSEAGVTGSTETVFLQADGGTESVDIEADVEWTATTSATSWLTVTPTNGVGGKANLAITALANNSTVSRSGFVYVNIGTAHKLAIPVSQEGISFDVAGTLENFAADGTAKQTLTVNSNIAWTVLYCPEWLTITPVQGSKGTCEITLQAAANNSQNPRDANLQIGIEGLTLYRNIKVNQEGVVVDLGDRSLDFGWDSSQREVEITFPGDWSAMVSDDWLSLSQYSGNGDETIVVTAKINEGEDARTGTITVASEGRSLKISVIQQGQYLKINSTAGEVGAMGGGINLNVSTTVGATAVVEYEGESTGWVTFEDDGNGLFALHVAYNPSMDIRTAQFVIKPTKSGTNSVCASGVKFHITQRGRSLSANVSEITMLSVGGTSETYTITADSIYTITKPEADDWYTLQQDSTNSTFYIVASENISVEKRFSQITVSLTGLPSGETKELAIGVLQDDMVNGHEYVDLGLPSGVMWATCNVGATKPEEHGGYYAWGETEEKENYEWSTYKWCKGTYSTMTKYCTDSDYGTVDNKTILDPEDDVARVKWGGSWRMPTMAEQKELCEYCDWEWITLNNVYGYRVTSKVNGNSIFLPVGGYRYYTGFENYQDQYGIGHYASSTLRGYDTPSVHCLYFRSNNFGYDIHTRFCGSNVRPVIGEIVATTIKYMVSVSSAGNGSVAIKDTEGETSMSYEYGDIITVVATPDEGYFFEGWFVDGAESPVSTDTKYLFRVREDVALVARFKEKEYVEGHECIDLGLPSGLKWAAYNVGATKPEEHGGYYAWGETEEKEDYSWATYKWCNGSKTTLTKYCTDSDYGTVDNKTVLDPEDDVAHVKWGGGWRMPTIADRNELLDNCTVEESQLNGVLGYRLTSKINGNSIFLPATERSQSHDFAWYLLTTFDSYYNNMAHILSFSTVELTGEGAIQRMLGCSVRPVFKELHSVSVSSAGNGNVAIMDKDGTSAEIETGATVTVVATPDEGYAFDGWFIDGNEEPVSTDAEYTFTVSEDVTLVARFEKTEINGHEYVDMGLPSGLKWATCNVGATKPEEYGGYYAWGETEEKEDYSTGTYKWFNGGLTKYCTNSEDGIVDNKIVLDPEDDVAHVRWGGGWRMPTMTEYQELINNCIWVWTELNGVTGYCVTSEINGNCVFFPASGWRNGTEVLNEGDCGLYWQSSIVPYDSYFAVSFYMNSTYRSCSFNNNYGRHAGYNVRPVHGERPTAKYIISVSSAGNGSVAIKDTEGETSMSYEYGDNITVVATPNEGYAFSGWYVGDALVSTDAEYTFTVSEDVALVARFEETEINSHEYVDLGLPSGVKWATCNVGATKPEEYGGYYAWGETEEKENYDWSTYKWCNSSDTTMTKYCTDSSYGTVDNKTLLDPEDDVAHVKWGGTWRMPTEDERDELYNNCTWSWTTQNGVDGYKVTGPNGNSIFLPAAGCRIGAGVYYRGYGYYWSSSLSSSYSNSAYDLGFGSACCDRNADGRYGGFPVRPVCGDGIAPVAKYTISVGSDVGGNVAINGNSGTSATFETGVSVTIVATPDEGYAFSGWYVNNALVSTDAEYTFTVSEDVALIAKFVVKPYLPSGSVDGYDYVDLGLPSGLKWATCNVDASAPEEYGGYYAWGETEEKEDYSWSTYKWCNGSETTMTKYCTSSSYGTVDNKTVLNPEDDVAHVKWGGSWRMPTLDEQKELLNNCTWNWTTQNGVNGHRVTSKTNGNSIFLPAAGDRFGAEVKGRGSYGLYRSSSLDSYGSNDACFLRFNSGVYDWERSYRCVGFSVRPVCGDAAPVARYTVSVSCEVGGSVAIKEHTETTFAFEDGSTVTVVATPVEGYEFVGWFVIGSETAVSTNAEYTFTVSEDVELVAKFEKVEYEAVDLGLPSGIKWATCNVGATTPAEYGGYYAWGETEEKSNYDWNTYKWCNGSPTKLTKYCNDSYWGTVDKRTILEPEDDVAHVKWGGDWRMPTKTEFQELANNCTWTWTTYDGVEGYMVTSKSNGNKIFLPAAGYCSGTKQYKVGLNGAYWSSLFGSQRDKDAIYLDFTNGSYKCFYGDGTYFREIGRTVRPVCE